MNTDRLDRRSVRKQAEKGAHSITTYRQSTMGKDQPNIARPSIFRLLTQLNTDGNLSKSYDLQRRTLQSLDFKSNTLKNPPQHKQSRLQKPMDSIDFSRMTKRFPFGKTTRPLIFIRPYAKASLDKTSLQRTKTQLYQQMNLFTEVVQKPVQIQYLTEYGDQFGQSLNKTVERKPKSLNIGMLRDKIMKRTRKSRYLERLTRNFLTCTNTPAEN